MRSFTAITLSCSSFHDELPAIAAAVHWRLQHRMLHYTRTRLTGATRPPPLLPLRSGLDRRLWRRQVQPAVTVHAQRVQPREQEHHWSGVCDQNHTGACQSIAFHTMAAECVWCAPSLMFVVGHGSRRTIARAPKVCAASEHCNWVMLNRVAYMDAPAAESRIVPAVLLLCPSLMYGATTFRQAENKVSLSLTAVANCSAAASAAPHCLH
jgi:hypothetical protein